MGIIGIISVIAGIALALVAMPVAQRLPAHSRTRSLTRQAVGAVIVINLLAALMLSMFNIGDSIFIWVWALIIGLAAIGVAILAFGLLTGTGKGWDNNTKLWLAIALIAGLVAATLVGYNLASGQEWRAIFDSAGLVFAAALLLFLCIARYGPEMEQASSNEQEISND